MFTEAGHFKIFLEQICQTSHTYNYSYQFCYLYYWCLFKLFCMNKFYVFNCAKCLWKLKNGDIADVQVDCPVCRTSFRIFVNVIFPLCVEYCSRLTLCKRKVLKHARQCHCNVHTLVNVPLQVIFREKCTTLNSVTFLSICIPFCSRCLSGATTTTFCIYFFLGYPLSMCVLVFEQLYFLPCMFSVNEKCRILLQTEVVCQASCQRS